MRSGLAISLFLFPPNFINQNGTTHPIFSMVYLSILRGLPLGHLSIIIPKVSTIWLRNPSDSMGFPLKGIEILTWHTFPINLF